MKVSDAYGELYEIDEDNSFIANDGSQSLFLSCPIREVLLEGTRGGGKTAVLINDFLQDVDKGYGPAWAGILFRQSYPQLASVVRESQRWISSITPDARFNKAENKWTWPDGETLKFSFIASEADYWNYHGHQYPWIGWEELTTWPTMACYEAMKTCNRYPDKRIPKRIRSTTNPFGPGHNAVKNYFIDKAPSGVVYDPKEHGEEGWKRVHIFSSIFENKMLMENDPEYIDQLLSIPDKAKRDAWLRGCWSINSGGMFDDVFEDRYNVVEPFRIPHSWRIYRSYDHGQSAPFSVGWHAVSDGTDYVDRDGNHHSTVAGDVFRIKEWYGCDGTPNKGLKMTSTDIATKIACFDNEFKRKGYRVMPGPADSAIWTDNDGDSIANRMEKKGVKWEKAIKGPGSRKQRCDLMREMLYNARLRFETEETNAKGYFVFRNCQDFIRTVPTLPRSKKDPDDVDTDSEDHIFDEATYFLLNEKKQFGAGRLTGW